MVSTEFSEEGIKSYSDVPARDTDLKLDEACHQMRGGMLYRCRFYFHNSVSQCIAHSMHFSTSLTCEKQKAMRRRTFV